MSDDTQIRTEVIELSPDELGFSLFNERGEKWEVAWLRTNGMEHYMPDVMAAGLVFPKKSVKSIVAALKLIVAELEKIDMPSDGNNDA